MQFVINPDVESIRRKRREERAPVIVRDKERKIKISVKRRKPRKDVFERKVSRVIASREARRAAGAFPYTKSVLAVFRQEDVEDAAEAVGVDPYALFTSDIPPIIHKLYEMGAKPKENHPYLEGFLEAIEKLTGIKKEAWFR